MPGFAERTMLKKPGMTVFVSSPVNCASTIHLDQRSRAKTPSAIVNAAMRREPLCIALVFPDSGGAGSANRGQVRNRADVFRIFPAAFAFGAVRAPDLYIQVVYIQVLASLIVQFDLRHNEERRQVA